MIKYILSPATKASLIEIKKYSKTRWGDRQAKEYLIKLRGKIRLLSDNPKQGKARPEIQHGYYSFPESEHVIFYRIVKSKIEIIDILYKKMDFSLQLRKK